METKNSHSEDSDATFSLYALDLQNKPKKNYIMANIQLK